MFVTGKNPREDKYPFPFLPMKKAMNSGFTTRTVADFSADFAKREPTIDVSDVPASHVVVECATEEEYEAAESALAADAVSFMDARVRHIPVENLSAEGPVEIPVVVKSPRMISQPLSECVSAHVGFILDGSQKEFDRTVRARSEMNGMMTDSEWEEFYGKKVGEFYEVKIPEPEISVNNAVVNLRRDDWIRIAGIDWNPGPFIACGREAFLAYAAGHGIDEISAKAVLCLASHYCKR